MKEDRAQTREMAFQIQMIGTGGHGNSKHSYSFNATMAMRMPNAVIDIDTYIRVDTILVGIATRLIGERYHLLILWVWRQLVRLAAIAGQCFGSISKRFSVLAKARLRGGLVRA